MASAANFFEPRHHLALMHSRIGDGVRAAAMLSEGDGLAAGDAEVLWEMAARAGSLHPHG
jgi:hypothetical protein